VESFCLMTFYSTHHALKAEKVLKNNGLKVELIPVPREFSSNCGISLSLLWTDKDVAVVLLTNNGVQIEKIHRR